MRLDTKPTIRLHRLQEETDPLLEQVFVYDYAEEENLGW